MFSSEMRLVLVARQHLAATGYTALLALIFLAIRLMGNGHTGPFLPTSSQWKCLLVVIDYTKWVKAESLACITENNIKIFF